MTVYALTVTPDGTVTRHPDRFGLDQAKAVLGDVDIATAPDRAHVIAVYEWSQLQANRPNLTAWACYGRSMLYGTACVWRDDHEPLADDFIGYVEAVAAVVRIDGGLDVVTEMAMAYWPARAVAEHPFVIVQALYLEAVDQLATALRAADVEVLAVAAHRLYGVTAATSQLVELVHRGHGGIDNLEAAALNAAASLTLYAAARVQRHIEDGRPNASYVDLYRLKMASAIVYETARTWALRQAPSNS